MSENFGEIHFESFRQAREENLSLKAIKEMIEQTSSLKMDELKEQISDSIIGELRSPKGLEIRHSGDWLSYINALTTKGNRIIWNKKADMVWPEDRIILKLEGDIVYRKNGDKLIPVGKVEQGFGIEGLEVKQYDYEFDVKSGDSVFNILEQNMGLKESDLDLNEESHKILLEEKVVISGNNIYIYNPNTRKERYIGQIKGTELPKSQEATIIQEPKVEVELDEEENLSESQGAVVQVPNEIPLELEEIEDTETSHDSNVSDSNTSAETEPKASKSEAVSSPEDLEENPDVTIYDEPYVSEFVGKAHQDRLRKESKGFKLDYDMGERRISVGTNPRAIKFYIPNKIERNKDNPEHTNFVVYRKEGGKQVEEVTILKVSFESLEGKLLIRNRQGGFKIIKPERPAFKSGREDVEKEKTFTR